MDFLNEALALGIDGIIFGFCLKEFLKNKRNMENLKQAPTLEIGEKLKEYVSMQTNNKVPYAIIRGTVVPSTEPLVSIQVPDVKSVINVKKLREHRISKGFSGFWTERTKLLHVSVATIPFELVQNNVAVNVLDPMNADVLDLQLISDTYQPTAFSFWDHLFGFISGVRQRAMLTTEEVLRSGTYLTAVGELSLDNGKLYVGPSAISPMFLTTSSKANLISRLKSARNTSLLQAILTGSLAAFIISMILRKYFARRKQAKEANKIKAALEAEKRNRRIRARTSSELTEENQCVVCQCNPKEIICLPCGHVCMCIECSERTKNTCPVCRATIVSKMAAFIT